MDIAPVQNIKPIGGASFAARPAIQAATAPVATDLPPIDTVQQASAGAATSQDASRAPNGPSPVVERSLSIDPDTRQLVYQAVNDRGDVVLQFPDQVVLRQRAYTRDVEAAAGKSAPPGQIERFV